MIVIQSAALVQETSATRHYVVTGADGTVTFVPEDAANADYQQILAWQGMGHSLS